MNKQVTLDVYHREDEVIADGDVVATTTSEFDYNGLTHCFDNEATEHTTVLAVKVDEDYSAFEAEKSCNGGSYGFNYYKVINADPTVSFSAHFKEEEIDGYMYLNEADDEEPLRFYDGNNQEQWHVPSNPYQNPVNGYMAQCEADYDLLTQIIQECDLIDYLVTYADESKEVVLGTINDDDVILVIN